MTFSEELSILIFYAVNSKVAPPTSDLVPTQKISEQQFVLKQLFAGDLVEASSNLFAAVKTTAL